MRRIGDRFTTFSLRGGPTASHTLSTCHFGNTAAPSEREIPHAYPPFRATVDATADDYGGRLCISG